MEQRTTVGVLGATSPVGTQVLAQLTKSDIRVVAFSRNQVAETGDGVRWFKLSQVDADNLKNLVGEVSVWIAASPIWVLPQHFALLERLGAQRVVCVSSTSQFTKTTSSSPHEEEVVRKLTTGEQALKDWAGKRNISWTILRPTLIYGRSTDRNLSEIVRIIKKLRFFPLFGAAQGLRQPIYVDDVATACTLAAFSATAANQTYNISGAERLTYKEMVSRVFVALGQKPRFITINLALFNFALLLLRKIPRYRDWNADMVLRMNRDMVFDHDAAARDFGFQPQSFSLLERDVQ